MTALHSRNAVVWSHCHTRVTKPCDQPAVVRTSQRGMRFPRRSKIRLHAKMNLHGPGLKPAPTAFRQLRRLRDFSHSQQRAVERSSEPLATRGHGELYMVNCAEGISAHVKQMRLDTRSLKPKGLLSPQRPSSRFLQFKLSRVCLRTRLTPLRGSLVFHLSPTACAVGCILTPLRG